MREGLNKRLRGRMAALRGARFLAHPIDMSRLLRSVRLAPQPLAAVLQIFLRALLLLAVPALAHEVNIEQRADTAVVLRLSYADGQPFAFEAYELYAPGQNTPLQVGRTNAAGQIVFLAGEQRQWRLKAFSADGHGLDRTLETRVATASTPMAAASAEPPPRWSLWLAGLGVIFGLFGLFQFTIRRKS